MYKADILFRPVFRFPAQHLIASWINILYKQHVSSLLDDLKKHGTATALIKSKGSRNSNRRFIGGCHESHIDNISSFADMCYAGPRSKRQRSKGKLHSAHTLSRVWGTDRCLPVYSRAGALFLDAQGAVHCGAEEGSRCEKITN